VVANYINKLLSISNMQAINGHQLNSIFSIDYETAPTPPAERKHIVALNHGGLYIGQTEFRIGSTTTDNNHPDYTQNYANLNKIGQFSFTDGVKFINNIFISTDITPTATYNDNSIITAAAVKALVGLV
jgi:hypothetical protein